MEAELKQKRLVLVSNGEPYKHVYQNQGIKQQKLAGGLTTGLDPMMQEDNGLWIAWGRGEADFEVVDQDNKVKVPDNDGYTLKRVKLSIIRVISPILPQFLLLWTHSQSAQIYWTVLLPAAVPVFLQDHNDRE